MEKVFKERFGERLKQRRLLCGFSSCGKLAAQIGITPQSLNNYENGNTTPDVEILCKLAEALNCTVDYLALKENAPTHEAASIADQTGLSPDAVKSLMDSNKTNDQTMQFFISSIARNYDISQSFYKMIHAIFYQRLIIQGGTGIDALYMEKENSFPIEMLTIDGAKYRVVHDFSLFLDEMEDLAKDLYLDDETQQGLDMIWRADHGKGEE